MTLGFVFQMLGLEREGRTIPGIGLNRKLGIPDLVLIAAPVYYPGAALMSCVTGLAPAVLT